MSLLLSNSRLAGAEERRIVEAEVAVDLVARPAQQRLRRQILDRVHQLAARLATVEPPVTAGPGRSPGTGSELA